MQANEKKKKEVMDNLQTKLYTYALSTSTSVERFGKLGLLVPFGKQAICITSRLLSCLTFFSEKHNLNSKVEKKGAVSRTKVVYRKQKAHDGLQSNTGERVLHQLISKG